MAIFHGPPADMRIIFLMRFTPLAISLTCLGFLGVLGVLLPTSAGSSPAGQRVSTPALVAPHASAAQSPAPSAPLCPTTFLIQRCGTAKCHGGEKPKEGLDLSSEAALQATAIGKDAAQASLKRIAPGDPEASYLFLKITKQRRTDDKRIKWRSMPPGPLPLNESEITLIETWIKAGAKVE